jgi:hypothetical protein
MEKIKISLDTYLKMGGDITKLDTAFNSYANKSGKISFLTTTQPTHKNNYKPANIYTVGDTSCASMFITVEVYVQLTDNYKL